MVSDFRLFHNSPGLTCQRAYRERVREGDSFAPLCLPVACSLSGLEKHKSFCPTHGLFPSYGCVCESTPGRVSLIERRQVSYCDLRHSFSKLKPFQSLLGSLSSASPKPGPQLTPPCHHEEVAGEDRRILKPANYLGKI